MGRMIDLCDNEEDILGLSDDEALNKALNSFGREMKKRYDIELSDESMDLFFNDWYYDKLNEEEVLQWKEKN